ncbi:hypothetical protein VNI00_002836 [Paramarasmius palmivorus]|uniref:AB hydrolase-1 domain-containing protein n=1 Tax=Paramarasmius palmivorus TaxID=297713 RepID=A0AAW0DZ79_9AGAR
MESLIVEEGKVQLGFLDSKAPPQSRVYTTIFAVHGMLFSGAVFKKLLPICLESNIRLVVINRRDYPGSTALTEDELGVFSDTSESLEQNARRVDFTRARGLELITFMDLFIQEHNLPPISEVNGKKIGGVALLGWSLGNASTMPAIAEIANVSESTKVRLNAYLRTLIMLEPALASLGMPPLPGGWVPTRDSPNISPSSAGPLLGMLVSAYYDHSPGAISLDPQNQNRDPTKLEHVAPALPSPGRPSVPTIYNMSPEDVAEIVRLPPRPVPRADLGLSRQAALWKEVHHSYYYKACFSEEIRGKVLPGTNIVLIMGDRTVGTMVGALWQIWDDNAREMESRNISKPFVEFKLMNGANHFMHWDFPQKTVDILKEILL